LAQLWSAQRTSFRFSEKYGKGVEIGANRFSPENPRFYQRCSGSHKWIEDQVTGFREIENGLPHEGRRKPGRVLVETVRQTRYGLTIMDRTCKLLPCHSGGAENV